MLRRLCVPLFMSFRQLQLSIFQYCAAAALGLIIYIAFGAVLGEANAAEAACQSNVKISRKWILFIQQAGFHENNLIYSYNN